MKTFASQADLKPKTINFRKLSWLGTLDRLRAFRPRALVPGRGPALTTSDACEKTIRYTQGFVRGPYACARNGIRMWKSIA